MFLNIEIIIESFSTAHEYLIFMLATNIHGARNNQERAASTEHSNNYDGAQRNVWVG